MTALLWALNALQHMAIIFSHIVQSIFEKCVLSISKLALVYLSIAISISYPSISLSHMFSFFYEKVIMRYVIL